MHTLEKKDISITGEEIFLPTDPESIGNEQHSVSQSQENKLEYQPLPTKPEDIDE